MKKIVTIILMVLVATMVGARDLAHYKRVVKELSSAKYQGRGYAKDGANKAGRFLQREFEKAGVDEVTLQPFKLDINTFCGKMQMWADGKKLRTRIPIGTRLCRAVLSIPYFPIASYMCFVISAIILLHFISF